MSQKGPVILSINPTVPKTVKPANTPGHAQATPETTPAAPVAAATPSPDTAPEIQSLIEGTAKRIQHRAALIATLAGLHGEEVPLTDVAEYMWVQSPGDVSLKALAKALDHAGIAPKISQRVTPAATLWPAIAEMSNGQSILILSQEDEVLTIYDTTCADNRAEVPLAEFTPHFTGTILAAKTSLRQMAERHVPQLTKGHWFWGELPKFRRHISEIMLGSLVANVLAVAVALFSLQVYDRVIPHQSEATLWVLAIGAIMAIGLEGLLKLARARLSDAAGRRMELSIQNMLMRRLLGMRSDQRALPPSGLFAAMRDFGSVREFFTSSTIAVLADMPFILLFLALVASIAGNLVWVLVLGGILMVLPAYVLQKRMIALTRQTQGASARRAGCCRRW